MAASKPRNFVMLHSLPAGDGTGRTIKEVNLAQRHAIPLGALVEIVSEDEESPRAGMRAYVIGHSRDCDGSPLYHLGPKGSTVFSELGAPLFMPGVMINFGEESLRIVS